MPGEVADAVTWEVGYPDKRGPTADLELTTQKSWLGCPPLSPKVFFWKFGDVSTFVSYEVEGRGPPNSALLDLPFIPRSTR